MRALSVELPAQRRLLRSDGLQRWLLPEPQTGTSERLIKQFAPSVAVCPDAMHRWLHMAEVNAALTFAPCAQIEDWGMRDGGAFIVSHRPEGLPLSGLLQAIKASGARLAAELVAPMGVLLLDALDHAQRHDPSLTHLDLDLDLVTVRPDGALVLPEFGLWSVLSPADIARSRFDAGRVQYCAPEVVEARPADTRSDVFSVGVLLYQLLTGELPFGGATQLVIAMAISDGKHAPLRERAPEAPEDLCDIIEVMLAPDAEERFQTPAAARNALRTTVRSHDSLAIKLALSCVGRGASAVPAEEGPRARAIAPALSPHASPLALSPLAPSLPAPSLPMSSPFAPSPPPLFVSQAPIAANDGRTAHLRPALLGLRTPVAQDVAPSPVPPAMLSSPVAMLPAPFAAASLGPALLVPAVSQATSPRVALEHAWAAAPCKWRDPTDTVFRVRARRFEQGPAVRPTPFPRAVCLLAAALGLTSIFGLYLLYRLI